MASLEDQQALLLYRVGPVLCCSPSYTVLSIIQPVTLTRPPGSDTVRPGIFRHSGHVVKTEELRVRFGVDEADRRPGRMIIAEIDSGRTAFWVDDIIDVISMPGKGWGQLSPQLPKGIFSKTLLLDDKIYLYAEFDALQKLQGHGLLKAYIEQLLVEKQQHEAPVKAQTTIPTATVTTKRPDTPPSPRKEESTVPDENSKTSKAVATAEPTEQDKQVNNSVNKVSREAPTVSAKKITPTKVQTIIANTSQRVSKSAKTTNKEETRISNGAITPQASSVTVTKESPAKSSIAESHSPITPIKLSSAPPESKNQKNNAETKLVSTNSRFPWLKTLIVILLLISTGTGIYYYFQAERNKPINKSNNVDITNIYLTNRPEPETTVVTPALVIETPPPAEEKASVAETVVPDETSFAEEQSAIPTSNYQASIEKDDEGITIVIKAPKEELVLNDNALAETSPSATPPPIEASSVPLPAASEKEKHPADIEENKTKTEILTKPRREEIIHIVVKGDTLWHIAKRYVKNPFRYPELARLSNIKNPDRIYPGNRVRIIREFN